MANGGTLPAVLTLAEAASFARVHAKTLRREIHAGPLKAIRVGRQIRIKRTDLLAYLRSRYIRGKNK